MGDWSGLEQRGQVRKAATTRKDGNGVKDPRFAESLRCLQSSYPLFYMPVWYYHIVLLNFIDVQYLLTIYCSFNQLIHKLIVMTHPRVMTRSALIRF